MTDPRALLPSSVAETDDDLLEMELVPTGPRPDSDRGDPHTAARVLHESADAAISVGVWSCTPGGCEVTRRPDTEIARVLDGHATITDDDGTQRRVVAGTVVVLPKGWTGRWDVHETVRKLYVVVA
jgi:uncharacterized cupin superfamily protein